MMMMIIIIIMIMMTTRIIRRVIMTTATPYIRSKLPGVLVLYLTSSPKKIVAVVFQKA